STRSVRQAAPCCARSAYARKTAYHLSAVVSIDRSLRTHSYAFLARRCCHGGSSTRRPSAADHASGVLSRINIPRSSCTLVSYGARGEAIVAAPVAEYSRYLISDLARLKG